MSGGYAIISRKNGIILAVGKTLSDTLEIYQKDYDDAVDVSLLEWSDRRDERYKNPRFIIKISDNLLESCQIWNCTGVKYMLDRDGTAYTTDEY